MKRSKFSLSHYKLFSCDMGELIPIGLVEVLPGDTIQHSTSALVRASPLLAPVMHPVHVRIHHFFVPHRLVWDNWETFITGGPDGLGISPAAFPVINMNSTTATEGSLADYLGIPPMPSGLATVSALPFRGYALIWNEFFRDQDLQTEIPVPTGNSGTEPFALQRVNWEKDYFTSARPWEQKGPAVNVPLSSTGTAFNVRVANDLNTARTMNMQSTGAAGVSGAAPVSPPQNLVFGNASGLNTGLQVSIDLLREAFAIQRYEEARARFGSRYVEYLRYLGVRSSDARLQRPEYLGGGQQTIQFSEVLQTAEGSDPVGDLKGHGIAAMRSNRYRRFFEEHGYIFSLMSVRPKSMYVQGVDRHWWKNTKEAFWQKELQFIGQQEILNREVFPRAGSPTGVFGYQDRYDEYRRHQSGIGGEFRSSTLNYWHMARDFSTDTALNSAFVTCLPTERTFAVPSQDVIMVMAHHSIQARRLVSQSGAYSRVF